MSGGPAAWKIWVDTGGTFTDCVALDPGGAVYRAKVLSSSRLRGAVEEVESPRRVRIRLPWPLGVGFLDGSRCRLLAGGGEWLAVVGWDPDRSILSTEHPIGAAESGVGIEIAFEEEAPVLAARLVTGTAAGDPLPMMEMRLATTRGTNALLERRGAPLALFVTRGLGDLMLIGNQQRADLFALDIRKPAPLYRRVVEVDERLAADGSVRRPLALEELRTTAVQLLADGLRVAAVALMNAYRDPVHEHELAAFLRDLGFEHISCSSDLAPLAGLLARTETALVNAYLAPTIDGYLEAVSDAVEAGSVHVMTSAGGLVRAAGFEPRDSLLSGPAGGVVGASTAARRSGFEHAIAFDMGGTSTDVARFDGEFEYRYETRIGDVRLLAPALAIETVAAGGGSICSFAGGHLQVGPQSSGAVPGPACYGAGGPLCLTDVNLLLGRLDADRFGLPIDCPAAQRAARDLLAAVTTAGESVGGLEKLLRGLLRIADERMADAIRRISVRSGYDPREYVLVAFGGAGGQHACAVAELLGMDEVLIPPDGSLLSAHGLGWARLERFAQRQILEPLDDVLGRLGGWFEALAAEAAAALGEEGVTAAEIEVRRRIVALRLRGQDSSLEVDFAPPASLTSAFRDVYRRFYGYLPGQRAIEVESLRVVASVAAPEALEGSLPAAGTRQAEPAAEVTAWFDGEWRRIPAYERRDLTVGSRLRGPAFVRERHSSTTVADGWRLEVDPTRALLLRRRDGTSPAVGRTAGGR